MRLGESVRDDLKWETDADFERIGAGLGEQTVIKPATTTEATAIPRKGKARTDEGINFPEWDLGRSGGGLEDAVGTRFKLIARMERQMVADDFWIDPVQVGMELAHGCEINLAGQCGVDGDGSQGGPGPQPIFQRGALRPGIGCVFANRLPHGFAELGFCGS